MLPRRIGHSDRLIVPWDFGDWIWQGRRSTIDTCKVGDKVESEELAPDTTNVCKCTPSDPIKGRCKSC